MFRPLPVSVLVASLAAPACVNIDQEAHIQREEKRFPAEGKVEVVLYTFDGSVQLRSWDRPEVLVQIEKRGHDAEAVAEIEVMAEQTGNRISVEARRPGRRNVFIGIGSFTSTSARFVANVPRDSDVVVRTGDGSILAERLDGRLELRSDDGGIRVLEASGGLLAETDDGSITLEEVSGRIEARTGDGSVRLTGTPSELRVRSGDGQVSLRIRDGAAMVADWMVATADGSVSLELPDDFAAFIEADPGSDGRVRNELELADLTGGTRDQRRLEGRLGEARYRITLRTGDGTIRLRRY